MRVLLFTGKGGVGKTTIAAATAYRAAKAGLRTMVMSTDTAHSLADSFDVEIGARETEIAANLWGAQIDAQERLERNWRDIQDYLAQLLSWAGVESIQAEELSVIPGIEEIFSLIDVKAYVDRGKYDLLVVDCAPTAETLRLLSLPEIMNWYIERIFPVSRRAVKTIRPIVSKMTSLPIAGDNVFGAVEKLHRNLEAVQKILTDERVSSVRLVVNPERMVIAEARRTYTYLSLFAYRVDAVIVNRLFPEEVSDPYFNQWKDIQAEHLSVIRESFDPIPILTSKLFDREMVGFELLERMGEEVYGDLDATDVLYTEEPIRIRKRADGFLMQLRLPFAERSSLDVSRVADELFIKVGSYKRNLILPVSLQRMEVLGASFVGDTLEIRFGRPVGSKVAGGGGIDA